MTVSVLPPRLRKRKVRPIEVRGDIAIVPLTRGREAIIDAADVPLVEGRSWYLHSGGVGHICAATKVCIAPGLYDIALMHRVVVAAPDEADVDHKDRDRLNNRRSNLRLATNQQNSWNQGVNTRNTSGFKGVSWHSRDMGYQASIRVSGRQVTLGLFPDAAAAARAYDAAASKHFGEFACLNFNEEVA